MPWQMCRSQAPRNVAVPPSLYGAPSDLLPAQVRAIEKVIKGTHPHLGRGGVSASTTSSSCTASAATSLAVLCSRTKSRSGCGARA